MGVTYDTGALVAGERNDRRMWAIHAELLELEIAPTVPVPVLAQAWRGGAGQARLARLLRQCSVEEMTEAHAKEVGQLAGESGSSDVVDIVVVAGARRRRDSAIVTSDPDDLRAIAEAAALSIHLEVI